jgi:hypothetical protein
MFSFVSSVRARLFVVIAGMAVLASLTIGLAYVATESDRLSFQADAARARDIHDLTTELSGAVRDQESAIDDYLLSKTPRPLRATAMRRRQRSASASASRSSPMGSRSSSPRLTR